MKRVKRDFHNQAFNEATLVKLALFQGYIRQWLPVFLTQQKTPNLCSQINIYDFFSGPGHDLNGSPGSPLIILNEVKDYCRHSTTKKAPLPVRMVFNDIDGKHVEELKRCIEKYRCDHDCCRFEFVNLPFSKALSQYLQDMRLRAHANLVIMDQFGVKEVTPEIVSTILDCGRTDILFFISSSYIRRFIETPEIQNKLALDPDDTKNVEYNAIHRYIFNYFRYNIKDNNAFVSPFSIKKGGNIYGVIFATAHPLGAEKFLQVCWSLDRTTGEANYNIDKDLVWGGARGLFEEFNTVTKVKLFEDSLVEFIKAHRPNNTQLYRYCLEHGFCSAKAGESLRKLQHEGRIRVVDLNTNQQTRKGFYLVEKTIRARFEVLQQ